MHGRLYRFTAHARKNGTYYISIMDVSEQSGPNPVIDKVSDFKLLMKGGSGDATTFSSDGKGSTALLLANGVRTQGQLAIAQGGSVEGAKESPVTGGASPPTVAGAVEKPSTIDIPHGQPDPVQQTALIINRSAKVLATSEPTNVGALQANAKKVDNAHWGALATHTAEASIGSLLAGGNPITLFAEPSTKKDLGFEDGDVRPPPIALGQLQIAPARTPGIKVKAYSANEFDIVYLRADSTNPHDVRLRPDDAAIIVRAFLLAKLTTARLEMHTTLQSLAKQRVKVEGCDPKHHATKGSFGRALDKVRSLRAKIARTKKAAMLARLKRECRRIRAMATRSHAKDAGNGTRLIVRRERALDKLRAPHDRAARLLRAMFIECESSHSRGKHDSKALPANFLLAGEDRLARWTESMRELSQDKKGVALFINVALLVSTICWVWLPYRYGHNSPMFDVVLGVLLCIGLIFMLLNALNLKSVKQRLEEHLHEVAVDGLNNVLAALVQSNANVAATYIEVASNVGVADGVAPEPLLCEMDRALNLKDRLNSIEAVVKARQAHVTTGVKHIEEHRDRVRRSITAAGSGVFVGFFTYEVGESVMNYLHLTHQQDQGAMLYWLFANNARITNSARQDDAPEVHAHAMPAVSVPAGAPGAQPPALAKVAAQGETASTVHHGQKLNTVFVESFHRPELLAHSMLLTITIIVSVFTAWIAMRKPAAEQAGGHGHH